MPKIIAIIQTFILTMVISCNLLTTHPLPQVPQDLRVPEGLNLRYELGKSPVVFVYPYLGDFSFLPLASILGYSYLKPQWGPVLEIYVNLFENLPQDVNLSALLAVAEELEHPWRVDPRSVVAALEANDLGLVAELPGTPVVCSVTLGAGIWYSSYVGEILSGDGPVSIELWDGEVRSYVSPERMEVCNLLLDGTEVIQMLRPLKQTEQLM